MAIKIKGDTIIDDGRVLVNADKIGIGTTNPQVALEIFSGDVGIGTTNPSASNIKTSLESNTNILAVGIVTAKEYHGLFKGSIDPGTTIANADKADSILISDDTTGSGTHYIHFGSETSDYDGVEVDSEGLVYKDGKVGIGTIDPKKTLHVSTSDNSVARFETTAVTGRLEFKSSGSTGLPMLEWKGDDFNIKPNGHLSDPVISIKSTGGVGIGTTNPDAPVPSSNNNKLAVGIVTAREYYGTFKGTIDPEVSDDKIQEGNTKAEVVDNDNAGPEGYFFVQTGGTEKLRITGIGSVGIGTTEPKQLLNVGFGTARFEGRGDLIFKGDQLINNRNPAIRLGSANNAANVEVDLLFHADNGEHPRIASRRLIGDGDSARIQFTSNGTYARKAITFWTKSAGNYSADPLERMRITRDGNVGIGTSVPTDPIGTQNNTKLAVAGIVTAKEYYGEFKGSIDPGVSITNADKINIQENSSNSTRYLTFVSGTSNHQDVFVNTNITYNPNFEGRGIGKLSIDGDVGIGGTLTVEDVTNVDSIGIVTAGRGLRVTQGGIRVNAGITTLLDSVGIGTTNPDAPIGTQNSKKLAVAGIVTAYEYWGEFKGTIDDSTVNTFSINSNIEDIFSVSSNVLSADDPGGDRIVFWDDTNTGGKLTYLTVGTGVEIVGTQLKATKSAGKTYTLPLIGTNGGSGVGIVTWTLTDNDSPVATDPVTLKAGSNISISNYSSSEFTIEAVQGAGVGIAASASQVLNVNGGEIGGVNPSGTDDKLVYWDEDGGTNGRLDYLTVGTGLKIESGSLKIDSSVVGKSYTLPVTVENGTSGSGGASGIATITLTDDVTPTAGTDPVTIEAGSGIVIESATDGFKISADISGGGGGGIADVQVKQYSDNANPRTERTSTNPIDVQKTVGIVTIGIGTTSNAYGNRFVGPNTPSGAIEGDIWYDTTTTGQGTNRVAILRDEKTAGAYGGKPGSGEYSAYESAYYPPGPGGQWDPDAWFPRNINTKYDPSDFVSVGIGSTNVFGLEAGSYKISWRVPAHQTDRFQSRLAYNTNSDFSGTTSYYYGTSQYSGGDPNYPSGGNPSDSGDESEGEYIANIPATTYFRIEQWIYAIPYYGTGTDFSESALGVAINRDSQSNAILNPLAPGHEVYTQVKIEDLATAVKDEGFTNKIQQGDTKAEVVDTGSNGYFIVETENTERLRITSTGQLNLAGDMQFTAANPELEFNNGGPRFRVPAANTLAIHNGGGLGTTNNEVLRITSDSNVGIGTTDPYYRLHAFFNNSATSLSGGGNGKWGGDGIRIENDNNTIGAMSLVQFRVSNADWHIGNKRTTGSNPGGNSDFVFNSEGSEKLRITSAGDVGIGTTNPTVAVGVGNTAKLAVGIVTCHEAYVNALNLNTSGNIDVAGVGDILSNGGTDGIFGIYNITNGGKTVFPVRDSVGNESNILELSNDRAIIDGNVGIGTTVLNDPVLSTNTKKLAVGIVTCHELYVNGVEITTSGGANVGVGTTPPSSPSPNQGDLWWDSDNGDLHVYYTDVNNTSQWVSVNSGERIQKVSATGGTTSTVNGYKVHKFTTSGTFDVTASGEVEVLVVAGGGSEGGSTTSPGQPGCHGGGGGGGGGVVRKLIDVHAGSKYKVTIGAGGGWRSNGGNSSFAGEAQALGGGAGGATLVANGNGGGSGGGASRSSGANLGGASEQVNTYGYGMGNAGGNEGSNTDPGGGGGAGGPGSSGSATGTGDGGPGYDASDFEPNLYVGAGGNANGSTNSTAEGRTPNNTNGAANTGAGGGGSPGGTNPRYSGGSGVVFVRYIL